MHPAPAPRLPKVTAPTPFSRSQGDLDHFKAECRIYFNVCQVEFPDELSQVLFILSYMKGGMARPWAMHQTITLLSPGAPSITLNKFTAELNAMFKDPNHKATVWQKLSALCQGSDSMEKIIQEFEIHGP